MIISSVRRAFIISEVNKVANKYGFSLMEGIKDKYMYEFELDGNNTRYSIMVSSSNKSGLVNFINLNTKESLKVSLSNYEQLIQFINLIFIPYIIQGKFEAKILKPRGWKRNTMLMLLYTGMEVVNINVIKQAMTRGLIDVVNANIDENGKIRMIIHHC